MCKSITIVLFLALLIGFATLHGAGKENKAVALGKYDFHHYYTYAELTDYLQDIVQAYAPLAELQSLCKSQMGRDVWMLVINNPKTGTPEDKPGFFLNQIHAGEVIASMSCCYTIWHLLHNYGKNARVTELVDNLVWYIVPRLDVDGAEAYLTAEPAGEDPNPLDDDGDFVFDEDPPEDIDGDGFIVQMRQKDPKGKWKISETDPRIMVKRAADETEGIYYKLYSEGIDNDKDDKVNEDSFRRGFLSNRNYPGNWRPLTVQRGSGMYPMEESVTRAEVDFVALHPHIAIYVQHHCCGRVILRPPATRPDKEFKYKRDLELYKVASTRCLEHSGWDLATSVYDWHFPVPNANKKPTQIYRDKDGKLKNAPVGMYPDEETAFQSPFGFDPWEDECECRRGYFAWGSSIETMYNLLGVFSMGDEHWNVPDYDRDGKVTTAERLKWNDEEMDGKIFVDWHAFSHPTLGDVEIGGWRRRKVSPPEGALIQKECEMGNRFVLYLASLVPDVAVGETEILDKKSGIFQLDVAVENRGFLPTATELAQDLKICEPVLLEVIPDDNVEIIYGAAKVKIGQIDGHSESPKTTYILRLKDSSRKGLLRIQVSAQKAGKDSQDIIIK